VSDGRERLTPRVRRVLAMAEDEAIGLRHAEVGTEHVLVALLQEGRGLATRALRELGVEPSDLAQRTRARLVPAEIGSIIPIGLGPGARSALQMARAEAGRLHHDYVGTEHLLLGLLRDGEGPAFVTLVGAGITLARVRHQIAKILNETSPEVSDGRSGGLAIVRGRARPVDRFVEPDPRDEIERCGRCGRIKRSDWRFCAYCGERWPTCDRCDTPLPDLVGVRFCPGCGTMIGSDDRA
jgi:ATP-dependent Clp protease ATP-binding subunit ClpC